MSSFTNAIEAGRAFLKVVVDDADVAKGFDRVQAKLNTIGQKMQKWGAITTGVSTAIVGTIGAAAKSFASAGAAIDDMTKRTGFSAKALGELSYAAAQSGTDLAGLEKAVKGMEKFMHGAARGGAGMTATLAELGVTIEQLQGQSPERQFQILSESIAGVDDPTTRAALAMKVFGKAGSDLLPMLVEGKAGIAALRAEARRLGLVMTEEDVAAAAKLDDTLARLSMQAEMSFNAIGAAVAGPLTDFGDKMSIVMAEATALIRANPEFVAGVGAIGGSMALAGASAALLGTALTAITAHPIIAGISLLTAAVVELAATFESAERAAEDLAKNGTAALEKMTLQQLEAMKSNLEWRVFFEQLDYRALHDEQLAGTRSLSERALAAVNNAIEAAQNPVSTNPNDAATLAQRTWSVTPLNVPSVDPMQAINARLGITRHKMGNGASERLVKRLGGWADAATDVASALNPLGGLGIGDAVAKTGRFGKRVLAGDVAMSDMAGDAGQQVAELLGGVARFFSGAGEGQLTAGVGTFSAGAIGSFSGGVDGQILDVLRQQLAVQQRLDRKDDPWKVG